MSAQAAEMLRRSLFIAENEIVLAKARWTQAHRDTVAAQQAQTRLWLQVRQLEAEIDVLRSQYGQLRDKLDELTGIIEG